MAMNAAKSQATFMVPKTQDRCKLNWNVLGSPANPASWYRPLVFGLADSMTDKIQADEVARDPPRSQTHRSEASGDQNEISNE